MWQRCHKGVLQDNRYLMRLTGPPARYTGKQCNVRERKIHVYTRTKNQQGKQQKRVKTSEEHDALYTCFKNKTGTRIEPYALTTCPYRNV